MGNEREEQGRLGAAREWGWGGPCSCSTHIAAHGCSRGIFSTPPEPPACSGYLTPGDASQPAKFEVTGLEEFM